MDVTRANQNICWNFALLQEAQTPVLKYMQGTQVIEQKGKVAQRSSPAESKCKTINARRDGNGGSGDDEAFDLQMIL